MGESYHPLPWRVLTYDPKMASYVVDLSRDRLENAPKYTRANEPDWATCPADIDAYYAAGVASRSSRRGNKHSAGGKSAQAAGSVPMRNWRVGGHDYQKLCHPILVRFAQFLFLESKRLLARTAPAPTR
jgi:hypothetical protein